MTEAETRSAAPRDGAPAVETDESPTTEANTSQAGRTALSIPLEPFEIDALAQIVEPHTPTSAAEQWIRQRVLDAQTRNRLGR